MKRFIPLAALMVPLVMLSTYGAAQTAKQTTKKQTASDKAIEARHQCFLEAQARHPNVLNDDLSGDRKAAYMGCAKRKGVRP